MDSQQGYTQATIPSVLPHGGSNTTTHHHSIARCAIHGFTTRVYSSYNSLRAPPWWFQHDNSPPFDSKVCNTWIHNKGILKLQFPPCSPMVVPTRQLTT